MIYYRLIEAEKLRAEKLHPYWPKDIIHAVSIMNEEAGESLDSMLTLFDLVSRMVAKSGMSTRAALNHVYHGGSIQELKDELIQTGAMVVRCLEHLEETKWN